MLTEHEEYLLLHLCERYDLTIDMHRDHDNLLSWILATYHLSLEEAEQEVGEDDGKREERG